MNSKKKPGILADPLAQIELLSRADELIEGSTIADLEMQRIETNSIRSDALINGLAAKLALSRLKLLDIHEEINVAIVFAVYKEHNRIKTREEHPNGEDFLRVKVNQLDWLSKGTTLNWEMIVVDDGDPFHTGKIAEEIIEKNRLNEKISVLFLENAIRESNPIISPLATVDESRKGGSILYGVSEASKKLANKQNGIVVYTDADLSTHLGQTGLLISEIILNSNSAAIGSRRESDSIVRKSSSRNNRGKLFIYLWKRLLTDLHFITDTQAGFKAFRANHIAKILPGTMDKQFAFDIELLLKSALEDPQAIKLVGIAWIDSDAESTTTDLSPYLDMLKSIVNMYYKYSSHRTDEADEFAQFISSLSQPEWETLATNVPQKITKMDPKDFGEYNEIKSKDLLNIIKAN